MEFILTQLAFCFRFEPRLVADIVFGFPKDQTEVVSFHSFSGSFYSLCFHLELSLSLSISHSLALSLVFGEGRLE